MSDKLTTTQLRKDHGLSRKDAVKCQKSGGDVASYKSSPEYQERAKRRAKQGDGVGAKPRLANWTADWAKPRKDRTHEQTEA